MPKILLNLGAGVAPLSDHVWLVERFPADEWSEIRVDADPSAVYDVAADIRDLPFEDGYADGVICWGVLEHVDECSVSRVLSEMNRVLKMGGVAKFMVPDLEQVAQAILEGRLVQRISDTPAGAIRPLDVLYGLASSLKAHPLMGHHTGFTPSTFGAWLSQHGFDGALYTDEKWPLLMVAEVEKAGPPSWASDDALLVQRSEKDKVS